MQSEARPEHLPMVGGVPEAPKATPKPHKRLYIQQRYRCHSCDTRFAGAPATATVRWGGIKCPNCRQDRAISCENPERDSARTLRRRRDPPKGRLYAPQSGMQTKIREDRLAACITRVEGVRAFAEGVKYE